MSSSPPTREHPSPPTTERAGQFSASSPSSSTHGAFNQNFTASAGMSLTASNSLSAAAMAVLRNTSTMTRQSTAGGKLPMLQVIHEALRQEEFGNPDQQGAKFLRREAKSKVHEYRTSPVGGSRGGGGRKSSSRSPPRRRGGGGGGGDVCGMEMGSDEEAQQPRHPRFVCSDDDDEQQQHDKEAEYQQELMIHAEFESNGLYRRRLTAEEQKEDEIRNHRTSHDVRERARQLQLDRLKEMQEQLDSSHRKSAYAERWRSFAEKKRRAQVSLLWSTALTMIVLMRRWDRERRVRIASTLMAQSVVPLLRWRHRRNERRRMKDAILKHFDAPKLTVDMLLGDNLLSFFGRDHLANIIQHAKLEAFLVDYNLCYYKEPGRDCFIIVHGEVDVLVATSTGRTEKGEQKTSLVRKVTLKPPAVVGSIGMVTRELRNARLTCRTDVIAYVIQHEDFIKERPSPAVMAQAMAEARRLHLINMPELYGGFTAAESLARYFTMSRIPQEALVQLSVEGCFKPAMAKPGEYLMRAGQRSSSLFILLDGKVDVCPPEEDFTTPHEENTEKAVAMIDVIGPTRKELEDKIKKDPTYRVTRSKRLEEQSTKFRNIFREANYMPTCDTPDDEEQYHTPLNPHVGMIAGGEPTRVHDLIVTVSLKAKTNKKFLIGGPRFFLLDEYDMNVIVRNSADLFELKREDFLRVMMHHPTALYATRELSMKYMSDYIQPPKDTDIAAAVFTEYPQVKYSRRLLSHSSFPKELASKPVIRRTGSPLQFNNSSKQMQEVLFVLRGEISRVTRVRSRQGGGGGGGASRSANSPASSTTSPTMGGAVNSPLRHHHGGTSGHAVSSPPPHAGAPSSSPSAAAGHHGSSPPSAHPHHQQQQQQTTMMSPVPPTSTMPNVGGGAGAKSSVNILTAMDDDLESEMGGGGASSASRRRNNPLGRMRRRGGGAPHNAAGKEPQGTFSYNASNNTSKLQLLMWPSLSQIFYSNQTYSQNVTKRLEGFKATRGEVLKMIAEIIGSDEERQRLFVSTITKQYGGRLPVFSTLGVDDHVRDTFMKWGCVQTYSKERANDGSASPTTGALVPSASGSSLSSSVSGEVEMRVPRGALSGGMGGGAAAAAASSATLQSAAASGGSGGGTSSSSLTAAAKGGTATTSSSRSSSQQGSGRSSKVGRSPPPAQSKHLTRQYQQQSLTTTDASASSLRESGKKISFIEASSSGGSLQQHHPAPLGRRGSLQYLHSIPDNEVVGGSSSHDLQTDAVGSGSGSIPQLLQQKFSSTTRPDQSPGYGSLSSAHGSGVSLPPLPGSDSNPTWSSTAGTTATTYPPQQASNYNQKHGKKQQQREQNPSSLTAAAASVAAYAQQQASMMRFNQSMEEAIAAKVEARMKRQSMYDKQLELLQKAEEEHKIQMMKRKSHKPRWVVPDDQMNDGGSGADDTGEDEASSSSPTNNNNNANVAVPPSPLMMDAERIEVRGGLSAVPLRVHQKESRAAHTARPSSPPGPKLLRSGTAANARSRINEGGGGVGSYRIGASAAANDLAGSVTAPPMASLWLASTEQQPLPMTARVATGGGSGSSSAVHTEVPHRKLLSETVHKYHVNHPHGSPSSSSRRGASGVSNRPSFEQARQPLIEKVTKRLAPRP